MQFYSADEVLETPCTPARQATPHSGDPLAPKKRITVATLAETLDAISDALPAINQQLADLSLSAHCGHRSRCQRASKPCISLEKATWRINYNWLAKCLEPGWTSQSDATAEDPNTSAESGKLQPGRCGGDGGGYPRSCTGSCKSSFGAVSRFDSPANQIATSSSDLGSPHLCQARVQQAEPSCKQSWRCTRGCSSRACSNQWRGGCNQHNQGMSR